MKYQEILDSYEPYVKKLAPNYSIWQAMKGVIRVRTSELTTEKARFVWNKRKDLKLAFPKENGLVSLQDPNYSLYDWCYNFGQYEEYDVFFNGIMDWGGVKETIKPEDMPAIPEQFKKNDTSLTPLEELSEVPKNLWNILKMIFRNLTKNLFSNS